MSRKPQHWTALARGETGKRWSRNLEKLRASLPKWREVPRGEWAALPKYEGGPYER